MPAQVLIVDDEYHGRKYLTDLLEEFWSEAQILAAVPNVEEAADFIERHKIDVLFLDVKMPGKNGFQLLEQLPADSTIKIVFVTAYKQYALNAIKAKAYDYLLKPVNKQEICILFERLKKETDAAPAFQNHGKENYADRKLSVHHNNGFRIINLKEILYLKASNNYTTIHLADHSNMLISKTLKDFEQKLPEPWFFRAHKSYIVNMDHFDSYTADNGGSLLMKDGAVLLISRNRLPELMKLVERLTAGLKT